MRLVGTSGGSVAAVPARPSPSQDWSKLIDCVRHAAHQTRAVEAAVQKKEMHVQEVLERVREDVKSAGERVRAAEARVVEIQSRTDALLRAADERVAAAEERARIAEDWLSRVYDTIASEFGLDPDLKRSA
ncbi:hypothetical protein FV222_06530 [Methylobacterium sp. WL103]|nr:hypothetical protein FV229_15005 [Methylobacterium sp. WL120]TXM75455.1 hypothetical protein FV226_03530 [Methylobacterium sp. WL12]TXM99368.1 hypothetical protein FV219_13660 [Methylobacterium sp. WL122]TXN05575.1 hypothetical protein FV222_06530 [Methylobacterium sp. WL103]TXN80571.1 hypothetical protein FV234_16515 [Methylobacterium sp. WL8]